MHLAILRHVRTRARALLTCGACLFLAAAPLAARATVPCQVGVYRLADGQVVDIAPSDGDTLRWRKLDGRTGALRQVAPGRWESSYGWTGRPDGITVTFDACPAEGLRFAGQPGRRMPLVATDTTFVSHGTRLVGRLVLPPGRERVPVVVLVHGAERDSARKFYSLQRLLPAQGVGAFVYDKRGTGDSGGKYTQDFGLLADDAIAAMHEARRLAGKRLGRIGYQGGSQAGWIVPIAARREPVDFAIVSFGLAVTVIDEDQQQIALEMHLKGYGPDIIAKAQAIGAAAERVIASGGTEGLDAFDAIRARYRHEPWYKDVHGNYTWAILPLSRQEVVAKSGVLHFGTPFHYDPMPTLAAVTVPQLWVLGGMDLEAPSAETSRRLKGLIAKGHPITLALYPDTEHGMTEFETDKAGERHSTRYPPDYFRMLADFARTGRLEGDYGKARITRPRQAEGE
ncbi:MAG TPA: CocE/NonD family hydrolase [Frateuria sp.]|uniref:alpha/beta hydrolase family protein n=1 Tax=Frateuria sp. TaxID=2211372 RepID=UPI002D7FF7D0|nr:CocE/NonD family hydrolase [Frateuria sp.]HET6804414.1 CocE/NonD family hydrolase [Frateuria sp.]